jgi:hypothetical protein
MSKDRAQSGQKTPDLLPNSITDSQHDAKRFVMRIRDLLVQIQKDATAANSNAKWEHEKIECHVRLREYSNLLQFIDAISPVAP